jgi:alkanesulfonate monooxygenase SsuD/methylene tetrahydromethanopterin reductase-like flavin-dependent oxidoreductase (luciferase family)
MRAWAAEEPFAFDGKYNQLRWVNCWPKPIQQPHPPIYIPGGGSIETWDFCLDHDYNYSYLSFFGYLRAKSLMDGYWERVAKRGKDLSPYRAAFAQIICVADSDAEAEELYAPHCLYFFNRCLHVFPPFADPPGYRTVDTIKYGALSQLSQEAQGVFQNVTWKQLVNDRFVVAGARRASASSSRRRSTGCASVTSSASSTSATCRTERPVTPPSSSRSR